MVTVLPSALVCGSAAATSGVGVVFPGSHAYSQRGVVWPSAM
jgi:hypothetical protein